MEVLWEPYRYREKYHGWTGQEEMGNICSIIH